MSSTGKVSRTVQCEESEGQLLHVLVHAETAVRDASLLSHCTQLPFALSPYISGLGKCTQKLGVRAVYMVMNPKTPRVLPLEMTWRYKPTGLLFQAVRRTGERPEGFLK